jgi:hypothetical protein
MNNFFVGLGLFLSINVFASETCIVKNKRIYHPDGTPSTIIALACTDVELQREILLRYESHRIGESALFLKGIKSEIIKDILAAGYKKVSNGQYIKD